MELRGPSTQLPSSPAYVFYGDPSPRTMVRGHGGKTERPGLVHPGPERAVKGAGIVCIA
jgi:hypothetical protein